MLMKWISRLAAMLSAAVFGILSLVGCDQQRIEQLKEGQSTEADVRAQFGEPAYVWNEADGGRTLEYNRQPMGHVNYMITIDRDGRLRALRQVLTPETFNQVRPGMDEMQVRRMLGMPAKRMRFALKKETDWDWQWIDPPNREMVFTVTFDDYGKVLRSATTVKLPHGNH